MGDSAERLEGRGPGDRARVVLVADTIFAPATASGRAAVSVIRLSGPDAAQAVRSLTAAALPPPRRLVLRRLADADGLIDEALVVWMPAPGSATGEDCAELHLHGSRAVVARAMSALGRVAGCRLAEPGEFTRRAFDHGRLDLTQVEALGDLIAAETEGQRRQALAQLSGALTNRVAQAAEPVLEAMALLEAHLEFPDEDLDADLEQRVGSAVDRALETLRATLASVDSGARLRGGVQVVLTGPPNVGKSSLLNALARRDVAIVSEEAGTTRDVLEVALDLGGVPVVLVDTAGLRPEGSAVELEGMRRARLRIEEADLVVLVDDDVARLQARLGDASGSSGAGILGSAASLAVLTKGDLRRPGLGSAAAEVAGGDAGRFAGNDRWVEISVITGSGLDRLEAALSARVQDLTGTASGDLALANRDRHRVHLEAAVGHLQRAAHAIRPELQAEDLRLALVALERLVGRIDPERVLDQLFAGFCIGK